MIAARGSEFKGRFVGQPLMAQLVKPSGTDLQARRGGERIELAAIEGGEDFLDVERGDAMSQLLFSFSRECNAWRRCLPSAEVYRFWHWLMSLVPSLKKRAPANRSGPGARVGPRLNQWSGRRSGCATAEPYLAARRPD